MNKLKWAIRVTLVCLAIALPLNASALQSIWTNVPVWHGDEETEDEREFRLEMTDTSIDKAVSRATCSNDDKDCKPIWQGPKADLRWLLIGQAYFETHLARHIHADECRVKIGECDRGRAKSLWQIQMTSEVPLEEWRTLGGIDQESTDASAWAAARLLSKSYNQCRSIEGAISLYATGKTCHWLAAKERAQWIESKRARYSPRMP